MQAARGRGGVSPHVLLGVTPSSNAEEVRAAYKKRALETHPDKGGDPEEFRRVKQAYEAINKGGYKQVGPKLAGAPPRFNPEAGVPPPSRSTLFERMTKRRTCQTVEEELNSAFTSVPGGATARRIAERMESMVAGGAARQSSSLASRVSAQAASKAGSKAHANVSVVKLWEKLTKLSPADRQVAMNDLDPALRQELCKYLETRATVRHGSGAPAAGVPTASRARPSPSPEVPIARPSPSPPAPFARPSPSPAVPPARPCLQGHPLSGLLKRPFPGPPPVAKPPKLPTKKAQGVRLQVGSDSGESSSSESSDSSDSSKEKDTGSAARRAFAAGQKRAQKFSGNSCGEAG